MCFRIVIKFWRYVYYFGQVDENNRIDKWGQFTILKQVRQIWGINETILDQSAYLSLSCRFFSCLRRSSKEASLLWRGLGERLLRYLSEDLWLSYLSGDLEKQLLITNSVFLTWSKIYNRNNTLINLYRRIWGRITGTHKPVIHHYKKSFQYFCKMDMCLEHANFVNIHF